MAIVKTTIGLSRPARSTGRGVRPAEVQNALDRVRSRGRRYSPALETASPDDHGLEEALLDAYRSRERRELAELDTWRSILALADRHVPQRTIADIVGLSQPEVSRRLRRRDLVPRDAEPREVILRRAVGDISTKQMMDVLSSMPLTSSAPQGPARFDGGASTRGTARQLATALREGLLRRSEYERLRASVTLRPADVPLRSE